MDMKRILAPVDFSDQTFAAVAQAARLAKERQGTLTLLHVHEILEMAVMDFTYVEAPTRLQAACDVADKRLHDLAKSIDAGTSKVTVSVVTGSPVVEIINASDQHDLIVMPTHGRKGISHFLMGSVAERVVRGARCSVLIVKTPQSMRSSTTGTL